MKILVTGGAGFIGSNFVCYLLREHPDWEVTNLDKLTYAGNLENLMDVEGNPGYHFVKGDITDRELVDKLLGQGFDVVVNFAAESHVDRSILDSSPFIRTNVQGTQVLLEGARQHKVRLFLQVSTDEVYGSLGAPGKFTEESPLLPNSPYAASKAAADCLCRAYYHTYGLPVVITRCSNNYGPFQFPEKLIPLVITNALEGKEIPVYGDGLNVRDWVHVEDHCRALDVIIQQGKPGEIYNIGGNCEETNLELVHCILAIMGKPRSLITFVADRPGHDRRYALETSKIERELGWRPAILLGEGLRGTVQWYIQNESWWQRIKSGEYVEYYERMYSQR
ncbi:dTDP-glucose 4,6-dehydratase [Dehalococcoidia bacterium]|nr:dTDP-glucose 4,6-dehydratase [Dehalococcoidia bacterium]